MVSLTCPLFTRLKYHHISCRWRRSHGSIRTQSLGHVSQARQGYTTTNISGGLPQRFLWKIPHFFFGNHPLRSNISRPYTSPIVFVCIRCPTLKADMKLSTFSYSLWLIIIVIIIVKIVFTLIPGPLISAHSIICLLFQSRDSSTNLLMSARTRGQCDLCLVTRSGMWLNQPRRGSEKDWSIQFPVFRRSQYINC